MAPTSRLPVPSARSIRARRGWQIKGSGDFNGDGKSDIVWQGQDGTPAIWLMDGTTVTGVGAVGFNPGASWHVVGAGQFNDDIKADILWQDDGGQAAVWLMDGMNVIGNRRSAGTLARIGTSSHRRPAQQTI